MTRTQVTAETIASAQAGDSMAVWEVVQSFDDMAHGIIRDVTRGAAGDRVEDLLQEARAVVVERLRDYNSDASAAQFSTYIYPRIRRAIVEEWTRSTSALTVDPTAVIRVRRALAQSEGDVDQALKTINSSAQRRHHTTRETVLAVVEAIGVTESLEAPMKEGDHSATLADTIADPTADVTSPTERRDFARWLMTQIPSRQSYALRAFYGVNMTAIPDAETAAHMQTSLRAVRDLRSHGIKSARNVAAVNDLAA
ncbi:sigma-70 family RNA polymerase sigma factor [Streptomyces sioyaensis]|uniref:sigma-70 family RNA polymerase sigma factor n=1 Tax=Streptomyces sioyaensis TaxID=67364 RepID=UPI003675F25C